MSFRDDIEDDSDRVFVREAVTIRILSAATGEEHDRIDLPELRFTPCREWREMGNELPPAPVGEVES